MGNDQLKGPNMAFKILRSQFDIYKDLVEDETNPSLLYFTLDTERKMTNLWLFGVDEYLGFMVNTSIAFQEVQQILHKFDVIQMPVGRDLISK